MKTILPFIIILIALVSCESKSSKNTNKISQVNGQEDDKYELPRFSITVPKNNFTFDGSEAQVLTTEKRSKIYVPKNAFVDKKGKNIKGKVDLIFTEYQTQGEIIASKLPMKFRDDKGEQHDFESGGMFEIRAYQEGKELDLKKGETIRVDLVSTNNGAFNFYDLNQTDLAWNLKDTDCKPIANKILQTLKAEKDSLKNLTNIKPKKPIELKTDDKLFDINIDFEKYENLTDLNGVMWKITETDEVKKEAVNNRLFKRRYDCVRLEPLDNEFLEFKLFFIDNRDTIAFKGAPVLKGKLLSKQKEKYKDLIASIKKNVLKENKLQDQIQRESELLRSFNVDQLGIYNCDRFMDDPNRIALNADFQYEGADPSTDLSDVNVYLIPSAKKVVIRYTHHYFEHFGINLKENNKLIAVLPNNEVYYLSNKDIHALDLASRKNEKFTFHMKKFKTTIKEANQLDELIAKI